MNQPLTFTEADFNALGSVFSGGDISTCTKSELERFAVMLSRPKAFTHFPAPSFPQLCETVRTLLIVRMSEEQNEEAKRESRVALIVAWVALAAGIVQAVASVYQILSNKPTQVEAHAPLPIFAPEPLSVRPVATLAEESAKERTVAASAPSTRTPAPSAPEPSASSSGALK